MTRYKKTVLVLGATGSIGLSAIDIIKKHPDLYSAKALVAGSNAKKLAAIALEVMPEMVAIFDESALSELQSRLAGTKIKVVGGLTEILNVARDGYDIVISGIVGAACLAPTMAALDNCKVMALANKESLVCAGHLITHKAEMKNVKIIPVDSEHSAIFQSLEMHNAKRIAKITLTASGGPFRMRTLGEMKSITPEEALKHPNWSMGNRITIDSATMANKGLEFIEACVLFPVMPSQVEVVIHPQSIIHSMVTYKDSSSIAQLGLPDMRTPIAYALAHPDRLEMDLPYLDLSKVASLTFEAPDLVRFPLLGIAKDCMDSGLAARIIFNAADEIAVEAFLKRQIMFLQICEVVKECLSILHFEEPRNIEEVLEIDRLARIKAREIRYKCSSNNQI